MKILHITTSFVICFFILFLFLPLIKILWVGLLDGSSGLLLTSEVIPPLLFTYTQAFLSSLIAMLIGVGMALFYTEFDFPWKRLLWRLSTLSFSMPVTLLVMALVGVWGKQGLLGNYIFENGFYGWPAILMAHSFFNYPLFFRLVVGAIQSFGRNEEKCALVLGASRTQCFFQISLWKIRGALFRAFMLSILYCASSLVVLLLLGGGPRFSSLEVMIYQSVKVELDLGHAAFFAGLQLVICIFIQMLAGRELNLRQKPIGEFHLSLYTFEDAWANRGIVLVSSLFLGLFVGLPLTQLLGSGLSSIHNLEWVSVFSGVFESVFLASQVAVVSLVLGFLMAYSFKHLGNTYFAKFIQIFSQLPIAISPIILGLSLIICYPAFTHTLREGVWGIVLVQSLLSLPMVFQALGEGFSKIDGNLYRQSRALGASEVFILKNMELPILKPNLMIALLLSLGLSLGETGSLLLFESQGMNLVSLSIYKAMGSYRFEEASALGFVLMMLMGLVFWMVGKWEN